MASGSFNISKISGSTYLTFRVDWSSTPDTDSNSSLVTVWVYVDKSSASTAATSGTANTSVTVGSTTQYENGLKFEVSPGNTVMLFAKSGFKVIHENDGSCSVGISVNIGSTIDMSASGSKTVTLDTIARASVPTMSSADFKIGADVYLYTNRKSANFTHDLYFLYNNGAYGDPIYKGLNTSINLSQFADLFYSQSSNAIRRQGTFLLRTFNGGTQVGDNTITFYTNVDSSCSDVIPDVTMNISAVPLDDWVETEYIQNKTHIKADMTAIAKKYASVQKYTIKEYNGSTFVSGTEKSSSENSCSLNSYYPIRSSGTVTIKGYVTDTRGIDSSYATQSITVIPYSKPRLYRNAMYNNIICERCDADSGELSNSGTALKLIVCAEWYSLLNGENTAELQIYYESDSGQKVDWQKIEAQQQGGTAADGYISALKFSGIVPGITLNIDDSYHITLRCIDRFGESDQVGYDIPTAKAALHLGEGGNKAAFGKYAEIDNAVEIAEDWELYYKGAPLTDYIEYLIRESGQ